MIKKLLLFFVFFLIFLADIGFALPKVESSAKPHWIVNSRSSDKTIPVKAVKDGYYYKLVDHQVNIDLQEDYHHIILDVVSQAGVQNASEINLSFSPDYQRLIFHEVVIWREGKAINKLQLKKIKVLQQETELSKFLYHGSYSAYLILDDIRIGDKIEYRYTIKGRNPVFGGKYEEGFYVAYSVPVANFYTRLIAKSNRKLSFKKFNTVPEIENYKQGDLQVFEWKSFQVKAVEYEEAVPAWFDPYGRIHVSEYESWNEVVNWALTTNPIVPITTGGLKEKIYQIKEKTRGNKKRFIEESIRFVQDEIRYMGIEIGEYTHRANSPEKVFQQRYGDCKDKSVLLASILQTEGIDAHIALVNSTNGDYLDQQLPGPFAFDHVIVQLTYEGLSYWIDPTISYQRGKLEEIYIPRYGKALLVKNGEYKLSNIKITNPGYVKSEDLYYINKNKTADLQVNTKYTGYAADLMRYNIANTGEESLSESYLEYYNKLYDNISIRDSLVVFDDEKNNILTVDEFYTINDIWTANEKNPKKLEIFLNASLLNKEFYNVVANRKYPIVLNYPTIIDQSIILNMWMPWKAETDNWHIKRDAYEVSSNTSAQNSIITLNYRLETFKDHVSISDLAEYRKDLKEMGHHFNYGITYFDSSEGLNVSEYLVKNEIAFSAFLTLLLAFGIISYYIYTRRTPIISEDIYFNGRKLNGWLIFIAIVLLINIVLKLFSLFKYHIGLNNIWQSSPLQLEENIIFLIYLIYTFIFSTLIIVLMIFCFVLIINKRDIARQYILIFCALTAVNSLIDFGISRTYSDLNLLEYSFTNLWINVTRCIVLTLYLRNSYQVLEILRMPYPKPKFNEWDWRDRVEAESKRESKEEDMV
jgi:transglutaminase-like putative cysteine protease